MADRAGARTGKVFESRTGRRVLLVLPQGAQVVEELAGLCRSLELRAGEVRATGTLEQLQVSRAAGGGSAPLEEHKGALEIVSFTGHLAERDGKIELVAQVFAAARAVRGNEIVGGRLIRARAANVELLIETMDDVRPTRTASQVAGLEMWRVGPSSAPARTAPTRSEPTEPVSSVPDPLAAFDRRRPLTTSNANQSATPVEPTPNESSETADEPEPAPAPEAAPPAADWQQVVAASAEALSDEAAAAADRAADASGEDQVKPGDFIDHPKFGRCQVERVEGDYEFISVRLRNQRLIRLSLDVLNVESAGRVEGRRLFRLTPA